MQLYLYSNNTKHIQYWKSTLKDCRIINEQQIEMAHGILITDYISYNDNFVYKELKIIVLDSEPTFNKCMSLMQKGVKAYGNVYMHTSHLLSAIESLKDGKVWIYPDFIANLIGLTEKQPISDLHEKLSILTSRESEIAKLIYDGLTNKEISNRLDITTSTVKNHTKNIYAKLKVNDRLSLFAYFNN